LLPFDRDPRFGGKGKYNPITGSMRIGFNGIVAFSDYLLNLMVVVGFSMSVLAVVAICVVIWLKATGSYDFAAGLATVAILMLLLTGMQFLGMGILGAYIGRIYDECKQRPKFIVQEFVGFASERTSGPMT
jgi:dolichol-phosphate mannosyltransferase